MPTGPAWTDRPQQEHNKYWSEHLPPVMWHRIMGFEETLRILTPKTYDYDKEYLEPTDSNAVMIDMLGTYIARTR